MGDGLVRDFILIHGVAKKNVTQKEPNFDIDEDEELEEDYEEQKDEDDSDYLEHTIRYERKQKSNKDRK